MLLYLGPWMPCVEGKVSFGRSGFFMLWPTSSNCAHRLAAAAGEAQASRGAHGAIEHGLHRLEQRGRIVRVARRRLRLLGVGRRGRLRRRRLGGGGHGLSAAC